jgi:acylphosphatase
MADSTSMEPSGTRRVRMVCTGTVQGVGFRWTCLQAARELGLTGWVRNEYDGSVTLELQGDPARIDAFFPRLDRSYRRYPIHYTVASRTELAPDPDEAEFEVRFR